MKMELTRLKRSLKESSEGREPISGKWNLRPFEWDLVSVTGKTWERRSRANSAQKVNHLIKSSKIVGNESEIAFRMEKGLLGSSSIKGVWF